MDVASARPGQSLSHTVARVIAWLSESGAVVPSSDTGAYSKARKRLPLSVIQRLLAPPKPCQFKSATSNVGGRRVCAYDGTTDAVRYRQPAGLSSARQSEAGCGFPLAKLVVLFCVTTGAVLEVSIAAFKVSEWEMSRQLYARLQPEDVDIANVDGDSGDAVSVLMGR